MPSKRSNCHYDNRTTRRVKREYGNKRCELQDDCVNELLNGVPFNVLRESIHRQVSEMGTMMKIDISKGGKQWKRTDIMLKFALKRYLELTTQPNILTS